MQQRVFHLNQGLALFHRKTADAPKYLNVTTVGFQE